MNHDVGVTLCINCSSGMGNNPYTSPRKEKHTTMQHLLLDVLISIVRVRRRSSIPPHCQSPRYVSRTNYRPFKTKAKDGYFKLLWNVWGSEVPHDSFANLRTSERWIDLPWFAYNSWGDRALIRILVYPPRTKVRSPSNTTMAAPWVLCPRLMPARCRLDKINSRFRARVNNK